MLFRSVMGLDVDFGLAYAKAQLAAGQVLPLSGGVLFSVKNPDKPQMAPLVRGFQELGFKIYATHGTAACLRQHGLDIARRTVTKYRKLMGVPSARRRKAY